MPKKLLIVEDDKNISDIIAVNATIAGYEFAKAFDGDVGLEMALQGSEYDLILLDLMLPKQTGEEICRKVRGAGINTPIIMITAKSEEVDKILGLELGADDYITKPFSVKELFARIKAHIRRSNADPAGTGAEANILHVHNLAINLDVMSVQKGSQVIELSKLEYDLLVFLSKNPDKIFSREELMTNVWKYDDIYGDMRTVDVTVKRLRTKIEDIPSDPQIVQNKRGAGYYIRVKN
ncbi:transcriptional regulatory protein WalR [Clostridia bacterium]|nr:transcriptional regulatory protein WalR [Clostridia bacterium]